MLPSQFLLVQSHHLKDQNNVRNLFKVSNKDTKRISRIALVVSLLSGTSNGRLSSQKMYEFAHFNFYVHDNDSLVIRSENSIKERNIFYFFLTF